MSGQQGAERLEETALDALREAELRYRTVADFTYDWEYWEAPDGTLRYVSPSCERITGYPAEQFLADPRLLDKLVVPEDREVWSEHHRLLEKRAPGEIQFRLRRSDGEICWVEHACQPVTDEEGTFLGYRASNRDITERKRAEEELIRYREHLEELVAERTAELAEANAALRNEIAVRTEAEQALVRNQERYALAQRAAQIGSWDWDISTGDLHWSDQIEPMFGFGQGEFGATYEAFLQCVHPEDRQRVMDAVDDSVEQGADYAIEHRIVWPDGTVHWVSETGDVFRDEQGRAMRMLGIVQDITDRQRAQEALRASEENFRNVAEQSPNMIFINLRGKVVYVNPKCEEVLGYARDEFYARDFDFRTLIAPDHRDLVEANFRAHLRGREVPPYEYALVAKDGRRIEVIIAPKLIQYGGGSAILGTVTDITARKREERTLRASQRFLQSTLDALSDSIAILDQEGIILAVNASWRRFAQENGLEWPDFGVGRDYLAVVDSAPGNAVGAQEAAAGIRAVLGGHQEQCSVEYPCHSPDGQRWFIMRVTRFESSEGIRVVTMHEDITERRHAEEMRARMAAIVESSDDAIIGKTLDGVITSWNEGAQRIYGYATDEVVGKPISVLSPPDRQDELRQILDKTRRGEHVAHFETVRMTKRGEQIYVSLNISPILDESGRVTGASTIARDITARMRVQQALRKAKEDAEASKREEEKRRAEAERRRSIAESLGDVLAVLNSNRSLREVLNYIAAQAGQLLGTRAAGIYTLERETGMLSVQATRGLLVTYVAGARIPVGHGALQQAMTFRQPVAVQDLTAALAEEDERALGAVPRTVAVAWARVYRALLAVPIVVQDEVYGGMLLYYGTPRKFTDEEIELATAFGDQVALAIDNARLREQVEQAATTAERDRLARELHDAVTQTLFSAGLIAEALPRVWERNPEEGRRGLEELRRLTRGAAAEMRTMLVELRPAALTEKPLGELLRHLTDAMIGRARIPIDLSVEGDCVLSPDVQVALYRIVQEALNNVTKHAGASEVLVELRCHPWQAAVSVSDDGHGFDPDDVLPDRFGVGIMRERAQGIGAILEVDSQPGQGTRISVNWQDARRG
jgi:two-component system nitrate/nitrite sensor histidine kinase NarX